MMAAIDVHVDGAPGRRGQVFQKRLFANGLNLKTTGDSAIIAPPLIAETNARRRHRRHPAQDAGNALINASPGRKA